jgi:hypothetical protein
VKLITMVHHIISSSSIIIIVVVIIIIIIITTTIATTTITALTCPPTPWPCMQHAAHLGLPAGLPLPARGAIPPTGPGRGPHPLRLPAHAVAVPHELPKGAALGSPAVTRAAARRPPHARTQGLQSRVIEAAEAREYIVVVVAVVTTFAKGQKTFEVSDGGSASSRMSL